MNSRPYLIIIYQLLFAAISIGLITIIEGYGTEMFAGAFYFNLLYLAVGGVLNYIFYWILQQILYNKPGKLLGLHFLTCLLLMNVLCFFLNSSWISWALLEGIFVDKDESFWVALVVHLLMLLSYSLAFLITKRRMQLVIIK